VSRIIDRGAITAAYVGIGMAITIVASFTLIIPIEWLIWLLAVPSGLLIGYYANQRSNRVAGPWPRMLVNGVFAGVVTGVTVALLLLLIKAIFFYADNGFLPALLILELMSRKGQTLSELLAPLRAKYFISGEINTKLSDMSLIPAKLEALAAKYADGHVYSLDGTSVEYPDWHFNVRASNTEPMLRLNLEAVTPELMEKKRDEVLALIRS